jgi:spore germination protein YaaH
MSSPLPVALRPSAPLLAPRLRAAPSLPGLLGLRGLLGLLVCCPPVAQAGAPAGVHAAHRAAPPLGASSAPRASRPAAPPTEDGAPDVIVYGYHAYWSGTVDELPYARLTHVAIFAVDLNSDGTVSDTRRWTDVASRAVSLAAPHGTHVHLTLTCFDSDVMRAVLPSASRRATLVDQLGDLVEAHGGHGVAVDCEGMPSSLRGDFVTFLSELKARVPELSVALPAVDWSSAYDYGNIARHADQLFIMGYGYHWTGGDPGPNAPLFGGGVWATWSLAWSVEDYRSKGVPDHQIVLGLPLYGQSWPTTSTAVPGSATGGGSSVVMSSAVEQAARTGRSYDSLTETAYTFPSSRSQLWYDDTPAVEAKVRWAVGEGLGGVGFWALNYEGDDPAFWEMMARETTLPDPSTPDTGAGGSGDGGGPGGAGEAGGPGEGAGDGDGGGSEGGPAADDTGDGALEAIGKRVGGSLGCAATGRGRGALLPLALALAGAALRGPRLRSRRSARR